MPARFRRSYFEFRLLSLARNENVTSILGRACSRTWTQPFPSQLRGQESAATEYARSRRDFSSAPSQELEEIKK